MPKHKGVLIGVAVFTWVQVIAMFLVDCTVFPWVANYHSARQFEMHTANGPLSDGVAFMFRIYRIEELLGWTISHFVFHLAWLVSSCVLFAFTLMRKPQIRRQMMQYAITTMMVCVCDLGATIHMSYDANRFPLHGNLFFPLFFSKVGLFWLYNLTVAVVMIDVLTKEKKRDSVIQKIVNQHNASEPMGKDNPTMAYEPEINQIQANDLVDNFYNRPGMQQQMTNAIPQPLSQFHQSNYKNPHNRPPYFQEYMQRQPKYEANIPAPDY